MASKPKQIPRLDAYQKAIPNAILTAIFAALALLWLVPIIGGKGNRIFWYLTFSQDIRSGWVGVFILFLALGVTMALKGSETVGHISEAAVADWVSRHIGWIALGTLPLSLALTFGISHHSPFAADEFSVLQQSRIFASGHITGAIPPELIDLVVPPDSQGFAFFVSHAHSTVISSYWPGYALLLTPFTWLGAPWLCNPVLTALSVWLLHRVAWRMSGSPVVAFWATLFMLSSSVISLSAATLFSMPAHLLLNLLFCWLFLQQTKRGAFLAGVVGSFALVLHNPLPHGLFALPWLLWAARYRRDLLGPMLLGYLCFAPVLGFGWNAYLKGFDTGPLIALANAKNARASDGTLMNTLSRILFVFALPEWGLWLTRLAGICKMLIWATPGLGVLAWLGAGRAKEPFLRLLMWSFVTTLVGYLFVSFDQGAGWGFRYMHSAWMALPILGAVGLVMAPVGSNIGGLTLRRYFAVVCGVAFGILLPFQSRQVEKFIRAQQGQVPAAPSTPSVTFIDVKQGYYTGELIRNDPFLRNADWTLASQGAASNQKWARRLLVAPRRVQSGKWGEIWVGSDFTPRYARWRSGAG